MAKKKIEVATDGLVHFNIGPASDSTEQNFLPTDIFKIKRGRPRAGFRKVELIVADPSASEPTHRKTIHLYQAAPVTVKK